MSTAPASLWTTPWAALGIIVTLVHEMLREGHKIGGASLCVGGGPAMASLWELV